MSEEPRSFWQKLSIFAGFLSAVAAVIGAFIAFNGSANNQDDSSPEYIEPEKAYLMKCLINKKIYLIDDQNNMSPGGYVSEPSSDPECRFDIFLPHSDIPFCLHEETKEVLRAGNKYFWLEGVGSCQSCNEGVS